MKLGFVALAEEQSLLRDSSCHFLTCYLVLRERGKADRGSQVLGWGGSGELGHSAVVQWGHSSWGGLQPGHACVVSQYFIMLKVRGTLTCYSPHMGVSPSKLSVLAFIRAPIKCIVPYLPGHRRGL